MSELVVADRYGRAVTQHQFRKAPAPILGESFGPWAGRDLTYLRLPGGAMMQFDLSRLTLADYRAMRWHYQCNASLSVLTFMLHQLDWHIECKANQNYGGKTASAISNQIEENLRDVWTPMVRGTFGQAAWAGFSPAVCQYENGQQYIELTKVKDLVPEDCRVNWKTVDGWAPPNGAPPKLHVYDGISQIGNGYPIPADNTMWYPLLMENGDYYGRKLLKPAFPSWFFSILIHLFANRYFERFGEPLPVGRYPNGEEVDVGGNRIMSAKGAMEMIVQNIRNRAVTVLPSDRQPGTTPGSKGDYEWDIQYLESQMRGADFERYMSRLDEEMSLGIFTPVLLFRTADVGSYNLGVSHMQIFQWCLNALAGDFAFYLERYPIARLHDWNFGPNAPKAYFRYRNMGADNTDILRTIVEFTLRRGDAAPNLEELGNAVGMSFEKITQVIPDPPPMGGTPQALGQEPKPGATGGGSGSSFKGRQFVVDRIVERLGQQFNKAWDNGTFAKFMPSAGFQRSFEDALKAEGFTETDAFNRTSEVYGKFNTWMADALAAGRECYGSAGEFTGMAARVLKHEVDALQPAA